ncbi:MAG: dNTP triphosphohydrolase [Proteobacteria bacterium]|nr:dNTP triphosphohydrolase [Pseudomonadota bacterium]MBU2518711.1 dNTP triphosphohydrolase [Pseudomonadota bacterium]
MNKVKDKREMVRRCSAKNEDAEREFADPFEKETFKNPFQRDRDRIASSKAFRRLLHKTQVYVVHEGHGYRTRLTHTLEVARVAELIATELGLNAHLSEAIGLAHDIGHAPFGHAGERKLDDLLIGDFNFKGGFRHNHQGVRVCTKLSRQHFCLLDGHGPATLPSQNLTFETLEGVLFHSKVRKELVDHHLIKPPMISRFDGSAFADYWNKKPSYTLEGQVAMQADDIAQIYHDLEDGLEAGHVRFAEIFQTTLYKLARDFWKKKIEESHRDQSKVKNIVNLIEKPEPKYKNDENYQIVRRKVFCKSLKDYMVENMVGATFRRVDKNYKNIFPKKINKLFVDFDDKGKKAFGEMKKFIKTRVHNNSEVQMMDYRGELVIKKLFEIFVGKPNLLPPHTFKVYEEYKNKYSAEHLVIADHISGMTDLYAERTFLKLHHPGYNII